MIVSVVWFPSRAIEKKRININQLMKTLLLFLAFLAFHTQLSAFAPATSLADQAKQADAVLRLVVVEISELDFEEHEDWMFTGIAKCRIVTTYKGKGRPFDFIYIPCNYTFDEDPSPMVLGEDCIVFLNILGDRPIGHPVSYDSVHSIQRGKLYDPEYGDGEEEIPLDEFEKRVKALLATPKD